MTGRLNKINITDCLAPSQGIRAGDCPGKPPWGIAQVKHQLRLPVGIAKCTHHHQMW